MDLAETKNIPAIIGKWHLLDITADETDIPQHRMDLVFHDKSHGAILRRDNGEEMPLAAVSFDGATLRLQLTSPPGKSQSEMPWLVMTLNDYRFEGSYQTAAGEPVESPGRRCRLKLVPAKR